jgi:hypothetical protein
LLAAIVPLAVLLIVIGTIWFRDRGTSDVPPDQIQFHGRNYRLSGPQALPAVLTSDERVVARMAHGGAVYVSTEAYQPTPVTIDVKYGDTVYGYSLAGGP